jgi:hypothetical protein
MKPPIEPLMNTPTPQSTFKRPKNTLTKPPKLPIRWLSYATKDQPLL